MNEQGGGGRERRLSPRFSASLTCEISLSEEDQGLNLLFPGEIISARTRDVSVSGLGIVAPTIYLGYICIVDQGRILQISLDLPDSVVTIKATPVHYIRQDKEGEESIYLIGLSINEINEQDASLYHEYLSVLSHDRS